MTKHVFSFLYVTLASEYEAIISGNFGPLNLYFYVTRDAERILQSFYELATFWRACARGGIASPPLIVFLVLIIISLSSWV